MRLEILDENNFVLFIIDKNNIPILEESKISEYLRKIFLKIKDKYHIDIYGYYNVIIFLDDNYGMIIKLNREEEYLSYYDKQIEMKIIISDDEILYKIENIYMIDDALLNKGELYLYKNELYLRITKEISFIELGLLIENSRIIFENTNEIKKGEKIEIR